MSKTAAAARWLPVARSRCLPRRRRRRSSTAASRSGSWSAPRPGGDYDLWARLIGAAHDPLHPGQPDAHRREHAGRRPHRRDQSPLQRGAARRHRDRHGVAQHAGRGRHEGAQRPLRSGQVQLARQSRGQPPACCSSTTRIRDSTRSPDLFERELIVGAHRPARRASRVGAADAEEPARHEAQDRARLSLARRHGAGGRARRGRRPSPTRIGGPAGARRPWVESGQMRVLFNFEPDPVPGSARPTIFEFLKTDEQRQVMTFFASNTLLGPPDHDHAGRAGRARRGAAPRLRRGHEGRSVPEGGRDHGVSRSRRRPARRSPRWWRASPRRRRRSSSGPSVPRGWSRGMVMKTDTMHRQDPRLRRGGCGISAPRRPAALARLYRPRGEGPFPAMIELHGGVWTENDRTRGEVHHEALARRHRGRGARLPAGRRRLSAFAGGHQLRGALGEGQRGPAQHPPRSRRHHGQLERRPSGDARRHAPARSALRRDCAAGGLAGCRCERSAASRCSGR